MEAMEETETTIVVRAVAWSMEMTLRCGWVKRRRFAASKWSP
jgi:hypothetical protein